MEESSPESSGGKPSGSRSKTPGIPPATRMQRNLAEKERRDKLNGFISELATLVPMVSNASKPLDKVSVLRLAAAEMRLHFSCLNPKRYKSKPLTLPPAVISSLDLIEKTIGGFIVATTLTGLIVFCSRSIEDYLGYQNIDVMGNKVVKYIYEDDIKYFESKVTSVVNSIKKSSKKKTKVIKAHMMQKPLPRSNETRRPRSMIFKISVHQNDTSIETPPNGGNGTTKRTASSLKKTRPPRDFGYSAVVLMFIEPVRLEPEIDITYMDCNQDVYFTRHGLQGEIIYADHRISTITGYMPQDVTGTSAYQYICSSDVPIALFAQKAMFTSNDGKGVIVYRLRVRDMRFIYLQSSGQIAYKESSSDISHFVCFNRLLSEEEGSQELKRFQQRYAPQLMASKMLKGKESGNASSQLQITDLGYEQKAATSASSSVTSETTPPVLQQPSPFQVQKDTSEASGGSSDHKTTECSLSSSGLSVEPSSAHSSEGHSIISPMSYCRSSSVGSDCSGFISEQVEMTDNRTARRNCVPYAETPYHAANDVVDNRVFQQELNESKIDVNNVFYQPLSVNKACYSGSSSNINGSYKVLHTDPCVSSKPQNEIMHSVNAYNGSSNRIDVNSSLRETLNDPPMELTSDQAVLQRNSSRPFNASLPNSYVHTNGTMLIEDNQEVDFVTAFIRPLTKSNHFLNSQSDMHLTASRTSLDGTLCNQPPNFNGEHTSQNRLTQLNTPSFRKINEGFSMSSLSTNRLSVVSNPNDIVNYNPVMNLQTVNGNYDNNFLTSSASSYNNGAKDVGIYDGLEILGTKPRSRNACETNGFHGANSSADISTSFPSMDTFDAMDTCVEITAVDQSTEKVFGKQMDFGEVNFSSTCNLKPPATFYPNVNSDAFSNDLCVEAFGWNGTNIHSEMTESIELSLNKELYRELDLFFQNLPQTNETVNVRLSEAISEYPISSSSYSQNGISLPSSKRYYHQ